MALMLISCAFLASSPLAQAWGCKGHQIAALIAESHMTPHARQAALRILNASPVDSNLSRYCGPSGLDAFADASTWADDIRRLRPETAPWHFIDIPLRVTRNTLTKYCPRDTDCVTAALTEQLRILRDPSAKPQVRAEGLRYIVHFVGDIHQPLHDATNNDLGGNCLPVTFFGHAPKEENTTTESYSPNLHSVWDVDILDRFSNGQTAQQTAKEIESAYPQEIDAWRNAVYLHDPATQFNAWAWEGHELAETNSYGHLPIHVQVEVPQAVHSCTDDHDVAKRLLQLNESLGDDYQARAELAIEKQLAKAGARLAGLLNSLWH